MVVEASNTAARELAVRAAEASEAGSRLRSQVALMLRDQGKYPEARAMLEGVVAAREAAESAGEGKVEDTLDAKGWLGDIMESQGQLVEGRAVLEEVVAGWAGLAEEGGGGWG